MLCFEKIRYNPILCLYACMYVYMYKIWRERGEPCRHLWDAIYSQRLIVVKEETKEL